jgi:hypothetical protein
MPTILSEDLANKWVLGNLSKVDIMDLSKINIRQRNWMDGL